MTPSPCVRRAGELDRTAARGACDSASRAWTVLRFGAVKAIRRETWVNPPVQAPGAGLARSGRDAGLGGLDLASIRSAPSLLHSEDQTRSGRCSSGTRRLSRCPSRTRGPLLTVLGKPREPGDEDHATLAIHGIRGGRRGGPAGVRAPVGPGHQAREGRRAGRRCAEEGSRGGGGERRKRPPPSRPCRCWRRPLPLPADAAAKKEFHLFSFMNDPAYGTVEIVALWMVLGVAVAGLLYAGWLVGQVIGADEGTARMREVGAAIRQGANAYLARQFRAIVLLVFVLTGLIWATAEATAAGGHRPGGGLLHGGDVLLAGRLRRHEPGGAGQPPGRRRGADQLRRGAATGLPHRHDHRHAHRRPGPAGRHAHLHDLRRARLRGPAGLRLRRHAAGPVHASRRRHLHQGGRRRRRPGRQGRGRHSRGRPAQRRHDRRQRRRQRRRLRRHGRRHLRELRGDDRRGHDPGLSPASATRA